MIPTFIIEEHHEAFFIWNYAVVNGLISNRLNILIHVDNHADLNVPRLETCLKNLGQNLSEVLSFTRNQLGIGDFIVPAVYRGLFGEINWLRQGRKLLEKDVYLNVVSLHSDGRELIVTDNFLIAGMFNPDRQAALLRQIDCTVALSPTAPVILDIDLDYFACDSLAGEIWEMQVTPEEYRRFVEEPYNRLHIKFGGKLRAERRDGMFYLVYQPVVIQEEVPIDRGQIERQMDAFIEWLQMNHIMPVLIDVCRSRFSGYTPAEHWRWIEEQLLEKLATVFPMAIRHLDELVEPKPLSA